MSKSKKLITSSFFGIIEFFVTIGITLFMTPFLISSLGDRLYGLWIFFGSFFGFYGMLELGLGMAVRRFMSKALGAYDYDEVNKIFSSAIIVFSIIGVFALLLTFLIALFGPMIFKEIKEVSLFRKIAILMGISLSINFPMRAVFAIFSCHLKHYINNYVAFGRIILRAILIVLFLSHGYKLLTFAVIMIGTDILGYVASAILAFNVDPKIRFHRKFIKKAHLKKLFHYSVFSFVSKIANQLRASIDYFVITGFISLESLTVYSIALRFFAYYQQFMASTMGIVMPVFSAHEGQNNFDAIRSHLLFFMKISAYSATLVGGLLILFCKPFIIRWVGEEYVFAYPIVLVLLLPLLLEFIQSPSSQVLYGISKHKVLAGVDVCEAIANLVLSILLVKPYGLIGVAIGTFIPKLIRNLFFLPIYVCQKIELSLWKYYYLIIKAFVIASIIFSVEYYLVFDHIKTQFLSIGIWATICAFIFCIVAFYLGFSITEQKYLTLAVKNTIKKKKKIIIDEKTLSLQDGIGIEK